MFCVLVVDEEGSLFQDLHSKVGQLSDRMGVVYVDAFLVRILLFDKKHLSIL